MGGMTQFARQEKVGGAWASEVAKCMQYPLTQNKLYETLFVKIEFFIKRGGTQEVDPQISSWFFVPGGFRLRWLRIWRLKPDPTTCSACSGRSAYGSFEKFHFRYSAWEKFNFAIKMLGETSWTWFWKDLVEMTPNKEVVMNIVKHMQNVILIFRFLNFFLF